MSHIFAATGDRVALPAGLNNLFDPSTMLIWHFLTTRTNGRRLWGKGSNNSLFWSFSQVGPEVTFPRGAGGANNGSAQSTKTYATGKWWFNAVTFDSADGPRIFSGDLSTPATEDPYATRVVGVGAPSDDSSQPWNIGNLGGASVSYIGNIAMFFRCRRRMYLPEIIAWQFAPFVDEFFDIAQVLGERFSGPITQVNEAPLTRRAFDGVASGSTVGPPFPRPMRIRGVQRGERL